LGALILTFQQADQESEMPGDDSPHWNVKMNKVASRKERKKTSKASRRLECVLLRGDYLKAPLKKFKTLASIHPDKINDPEECARFWQSVLLQFGSLPADLIDSETQELLFRKILRWVKYEKMRPAVRTPSPPTVRPRLSPWKEYSLALLRASQPKEQFGLGSLRKGVQPVEPPLIPPERVLTIRRETVLRRVVEKIVEGG
jgi:hypothetical protein